MFKKKMKEKKKKKQNKNKQTNKQCEGFLFNYVLNSLARYDTGTKDFYPRSSNNNGSKKSFNIKLALISVSQGNIKECTIQFRCPI